MTDIETFRQQHTQDIEYLRSISRLIYRAYPQLKTQLDQDTVNSITFTDRNLRTAEGIEEFLGSDSHGFRVSRIFTDPTITAAVCLSHAIIEDGISNTAGLDGAHINRQTDEETSTVTISRKYGLGLLTSSDWTYAQLNLVKDSKKPFENIEKLIPLTARLMALPFEVAPTVSVFCREETLNASVKITDDGPQVMEISPIGNLIRFARKGRDESIPALTELSRKIKIGSEIFDAHTPEGVDRTWFIQNILLPICTLPDSILSEDEIAYTLMDIDWEFIDLVINADIPGSTDPFFKILNAQESLSMYFKERSDTRHLLDSDIDETGKIKYKHITLPLWDYDKAFSLICPALFAQLNVVQTRAALAAYKQIDLLNEEVVDNFEFSDLFDTLSEISILLTNPANSQRNIGARINEFIKRTGGEDANGNAGKVLGELFEIAKAFLRIHFDVENEIALKTNEKSTPKDINHLYAQAWEELDFTEIYETFKSFTSKEDIKTVLDIYRNNGGYNRYGLSLKQLLERLKEIE